MPPNRAGFQNMQRAFARSRARSRHGAGCTFAICGTVKPERVFDAAEFPHPEWNEGDKCTRCAKAVALLTDPPAARWLAWRPFASRGTLYGPFTKKMHAFLGGAE